MGACCTCQRIERFDGLVVQVAAEERGDTEDGGEVMEGDCGARVRLRGSSKYVSMFSQQGKKGVNQDAMTVWEEFIGEKDSYFCGVFDGHGPQGHKVARYVRDTLPSKLSSSSKSHNNNNGGGKNGKHGKSDEPNPHFSSSWKSNILKSFQDMDDDLQGKPTIDSYCSGTTAVTVIKQGSDLMVVNMGDSRAVLCTRGDRDELVPIQLTADLKPGVPSERERIESRGGRVLALAEEPSVLRVWLPDQDSPGLAMARAFGDFCLKDFGLISTPDVTHRKLCDKDEFVVLATDGVWDVLSNNEVIKIVASVRKRSMAARLLVDRAVQAWRYRYPNAKIDDCAVVCLFFKRQGSSLTKSVSEVAELSLNYSGLQNSQQPSKIATEDGLETVLNCDLKTDRDAVDEGTAQDNPLPHGGSVKRRRPARDFEYAEN
ncbi:hypothetical protein LguiA_016449 [Lonicera macranthoides]